MSDKLLAMGESQPRAPAGARAKALGAYYTPETAVQFMIRWAVRDASHKLIDPSFGNGQFLSASAAKLGLLDPSEQIFGIEYDKQTFDAARDFLEKRYNIVKLKNEDFFRSDDFFKQHFGEQIPIRAFEAVVGNPPFIRYQRFKGEMRERALKRALEHGVELPGHASSWAPFLVHAVSLIKPGGRLVMVTPAELGYAAYAKKVLEYLLDQFALLTILSFQKRLFPKLGEDTLIVLGDRHGQQAKQVQLVDIESESKLETFIEGFELTAFDLVGKVKTFEQHELTAFKSHKTRLLEYLLDDETRRLYQRLKTKTPAIKTLGNVARIGIGYVTGDNDFFHPSAESIKSFRLPKSYLEPCIRRSNNLPGICLRYEDWESDSEVSKYLLKIPADKAFEELPKGLQAYLKNGIAQGILKRYKVRSREPWYSVPHIKTGEAFLTYMSGEAPRLVHNALGLPAPNTLHSVKLEENLFDKIDVKLLVVAWYTSLTFLSAEIEGHSLGGGLLKLEPGEAKKVLIALPEKLSAKAINKAYEQMDSYLRQNKLGRALDVGDRLILEKGLGLSKEDCTLLRQAYQYLRERRLRR